MRHNSIISREGWPIIGFFAVLGIFMLYLSFYILSFLAFILSIFSLYFFRNPERLTKEGRGLVFSPADGKVLDITTIIEEEFLNAEVKKIRIFMNLFNVHVNRIPIAGKVEWVNKKGGIFLPAHLKEAGDKNVRTYTGLLSEYGELLVVQITGIFARRIVCWVKPGDNVDTGERFGLIRFGSCVELYLPLEAEIQILPGQRVKGGETIIARFIE
jgi:phosphatidylserine decarboxylase